MLTTYKTKLIKKISLAKDVFLFRFQLLDPEEINFLPGQYLILKIGNYSRLYSIASPNFQKDSFDLIIKIIPEGLGSTYLNNLQMEEEVVFQGPAGVFTLKETDRDKIFLATGTGIAPIRSMLLSNFKFHTNFKFHLFLGFRHYQDVFLFNELKSYQRQNGNFDFKICLSREKSLQMISEDERKYFFLGRVTNYLEFLPHQSIVNCDFYLCSRREVVESLKSYLYQKGIPKEQVFFEKF